MSCLLPSSDRDPDKLCFLEKHPFTCTRMAEAIENRGAELMGVNIAFYSIAVITCLLRCYVRSFVVDAFRTDDWLMVVSTVCFTVRHA
jgi:hypothetical protein